VISEVRNFIQNFLDFHGSVLFTTFGLVPLPPPGEATFIITWCWYVLSPTWKETGYSDQTLNFASHSKKYSESCPSNQVSAATVNSVSYEKRWPFNCLFSRVGLRTYQHPCIHCRITDLEKQNAGTWWRKNI